ncbi:Ubiquitin family protein [Tritrichomonas foetus]|uniref:Ubiquitin family protein n=1 Tax=Tritrichomonas foetus TaxID=1144522 RepID=A0A1J4JI73_9EUKA|nr:Ubiquitin family protein [Tritrichomonas foetus]|eukprot:OHS97213.1 Ubiquitin family protein [Tritrichomonas foetus]
MMNLLNLSNRPISIRIRRSDGTGFSVEIDKYSTVLSLKENISEKIGYSPEQQRLVFSGQVLKDDMSLSFYKIRDGSQVYMVPAKIKSTSHPRPYQLLNRLLNLLDEFPNVKAEDYTLVIDEINDIINNPVVQSFGRINSDVQQLFKDAQEIIENSERPLSRKTRDFIARSKDAVFDQFDSSPEGFRILQSLVDDSDDFDPSPPHRTNLKYKSRISARPLPDPWNSKPKKRTVFQNVAMRMSVPTAALLFPESPRTEENLPLIKGKPPTFDSNFSITLKSKFAEQMVALKKMGFHDEDIMLQALSETNGNVQLAAQILKHKFM